MESIFDKAINFLHDAAYYRFASAIFLPILFALTSLSFRLPRATRSMYTFLEAGDSDALLPGTRPGLWMRIRRRPWTWLSLTLIIVTMALLPKVVSPTIGLQPAFIPASDSRPTSLLLMIHGWNGDPTETWKQFPSLFRQDPRFRKTDILLVHYPTFIVRRNLHIPGLSKFVREQLQDYRARRPYESMAILSHSMGGLIARKVMLLDHIGGADTVLPLAQISIEIATPHAGVAAADIARALGIPHEYGEDLAIDSPLLQDIQVDWRTYSKHPVTVAFLSPQDGVVSETSASAACDDCVSIPGFGHVELAKPLTANDHRYSLPMNRLKALWSTETR
jgi:hypothetical protein